MNHLSSEFICVAASEQTPFPWKPTNPLVIRPLAPPFSMINVNDSDIVSWKHIQANYIPIMKWQHVMATFFVIGKKKKKNKQEIQ